MIRLGLALAVALAVAVQQPAPFNPVVPDNAPATAPVDDTPEAYPGQHAHAAPPEGWQCMRAPVDLSGDQSHYCSCERTCDTDTQVIHEDKRCAVYCHMDACTCTQNATMKRCMPEAQR